MRLHVFYGSVAVLALVAAGASAPARAQDSAPPAAAPQSDAAASDTPAPVAAPLETSDPNAEIIVTGSRISRRDYASQSPIVTASKEALQNTGTATVDAALVQLPQFQPGAGGFTNSSQGGLGVGQATLNLRGLGSVRTLVLLDGRRLQPGNAQSVIDINTLPSSAISGVEVITGGASATYGSDALAGVVNFKLYHSFDGLQLDGQVGVSEEGDAATQQVSFIAGTKFGGGAGSIMVAGEYANREGLTYRDRDFSTPSGAYSTVVANGYYAPTATNLPSQAAVNTVFGRYGVTAGTVARTASFGINQDSTLYRNSATVPVNYRPDGSQCSINLPTAFGYDGFCTNTLQLPLERYAFMARAQYDLGGDTTVFVQGQYSHSTARGQGSHPALLPTGASGLAIPVTNPFIPADLRALLASRPDPTASFVFTKRFLDAGPRSFENQTETFQIVTGLQGRIAAIDWTYELYGSHGETHADDRSFNGSISLSAVQRLLNAADGGASLCSGGFNIFGTNPVSPACVAYVRRDTLTQTTIKQDEVALNLSGGLFNLPAGEVKVALSGNYRRNSYRADPDPVLQAGDIAAVVAIQPTRGKTNVAEGAVEVLIPVLADLPLIQSLNLTAGYRYSHYDPTGGVSSYKLNFDWRVARPLLLRGGYQKAVRAPNIGELFLARSGVLANIGNPPGGGDPCDIRSNYRLGANAAAVRTLCIAQGVPTALIDSFNQVNGGIQATAQGNSALNPESAKTWTVGAVFQPTFAPRAFSNINLSVDYYDIRITDVIGTLDVPTSVAKCFNGDGSNPTYSATSSFCQNLVRSTANGQIVNSFQQLLNLGGYRTAGLDIAFDWRLPLDSLGLGDIGALTTNLTVNYLDKFEIQVAPGSPFQDYAGVVSSSSGTSAQSYPKWKMAGSLLYDKGGFQIGVRWRHIDSMLDISRVTNPTSTIAGAEAYDYFDLIGRIRVNEDFELRGGITNLADKTPPGLGGFSGQTNMGVYDVVGRAFYIGAKAKF